MFYLGEERRINSKYNFQTIFLWIRSAEARAVDNSTLDQEEKGR